MRIAFFYGPVWIAILATLTIYIVTGVGIFQKRATLRSFTRQSFQESAAVKNSSAIEERPTKPFSIGRNIVVTTQIKHDVEQDAISRCVSFAEDEMSLSSFASTRNLSKNNTGHGEQTVPVVPIAPTIRNHQDYRKSAETEPSANERNGYRATVSAANTTTTPTTDHAANPTVGQHTYMRPAKGNTGHTGYIKVAFLMFIALFVVWLPSSVNRVYQFVHKNDPSYALNLMSAVVLPLQGAWNACIYMLTTRKECKRAYGLIRAKLTGEPPKYQPENLVYRRDTMISSRHTRDNDAEIGLEEMLKQGEQVRHSQVSNPDSVLAARSYRQ